MPEVIRRQKEGVSGGPRANCRFSEGAWAAIKAAAVRDGYDNPTKWVRDAAIKAAGYEAPAEATPEVPWVVSDADEPSEVGVPVVATETIDPDDGDVMRPAPPKPRARAKKKPRAPKPAPAPSVPEPGRGKTHAREASILELAKGALRRLLE